MPASEDTASGRAIVRREVVEIPDVEADSTYGARGQGLAKAVTYRSIAAVPLLHESNPIGAIAVARANAGPFPKRQIVLLQAFADQAVIAIGNVGLFDEVQTRTRELSESLQQQTATAEVLKVISRSTFDLQAVLDTLIESAVRLCEADHGWLFRREGKILHWVASFGYGTDAHNRLREFFNTREVVVDRGSVTGRATLEARTVQVPDVLLDPDYTYGDAQKVGGYRAGLGVPLLRTGEVIGVIFVNKVAPVPFSDKQVELVTTFADQAVIAIENVRLFESVEARTRELAKSLEDLRSTQDRLVQTQKLASLGQLTAGIAHEIKNPLNFVNNFSGVSTELIDELQDVLSGISIDHKARAEITELTDTLRGNLEKVVQHGKRADAIVKNMLLHSREGSGEHRVVDVNALVDESLNLAWHGARAEKQGFNITLERSFDPTAGEADVFPQDITRVLLNLISNGFYAATQRKAETDGGGYEPILAASTKSLGDRVEIRIRDNGTGIPREVKEKMFNPFFTTKPAGEGTGLGLSISHDIVVKQHGGSIEVDTQPGEFTEFRIILPRAAVFLAESGGRG
jgi:signal transduction histidine kinase